MAATQFIIYDLEWTTWPLSREQRWSAPGEHREVVQMGAIRVDAATLDEIDAFSLYVKPKVNPQLSEFFVEFTGITQSIVDGEGVSFTEAFQRFCAWCEDLTLYSWGRNDDAVLRENCELNGIAFPLADTRFVDVKAVFKAAQIDISGYRSSTIIQAFGKEAPYRGHHGLNDARTVLLGLKERPGVQEYLSAR